jgi:hypothetical protein
MADSIWHRAAPFQKSGSILMISFFGEFWEFLRVRKKFWLLPIFVSMALVGGLIVATEGSAIAPFIYTLF